jgi:hypothetical protein
VESLFGYNGDGMYHYPSDEIVDQIIKQLEGLPQYECQSGTESEIKEVLTPNEVGVGFQEGETNYMVDHGHYSDPTRNTHEDDKASFEEFFKRPVKIFQTEWGTGSALAAEVAPFFAYFTNPRVANRISNFNLLKATLRIKVMVNGNGFFFGRAMAAYHPLCDYDQLSTHAALVPQDLTQTSQLPKVFIDPTTSTGGEMTLPFFWHQDFVDITNSLDNTANLGTLFFRDFSNLKHAQSANDGVTITVLAWCEDITLAVPTTVNAYQLTPQSGKEDEVDTANKQGIVSGPATNLAKMGKALSNVPVIGPYAMAASKVASGVAAGAKLLGYSRPAMSSVDKFRPTPTGSLALGNVPDTVPKLSLDEKQELSIDPRIAGLSPNDPLLLRNIAQRESYYTKFNWQRGDASDVCLFQSYVSPVVWTTSGGGNTIHLPACGAAALPFSNWTGRMRFRFQVVSSAFHRGRLRVVYDPNELPYELDEYNVNYQQVIDVGDERDFTIEIGMGKQMTYLRHNTPGTDPVPFVNGPTSQLDVLPQVGLKSNGVIGMYVVNELSVPSTSSANNNVEINVFVSAGDDFAVGIPDDSYQRYVFKPQSGLEADFDGQATPEGNRPQQNKTYMLNYTETQDDINKVFMGESIVSFRPLLKRYTIHRRLPLTTTSGVRDLFERQCCFPFLRGNVPNAINTTGAGDPYNYCNTVMLHWVRNMFAGWRGGIRYKIRIDPSPNFGNGANVPITGIIERNNPSASGIDQYYLENTATGPATAGNGTYQASVLKGTSNRWDVTRGGTMMVSTVNPVMEAEIPYYAPTRFVPEKLSDYTGFPNFIEIPQMLVQIRGYMQAWNIADYYVAAGDDFQVYFFTGMPRLYFEDSPPSPNPP